jgi:PAS domain S-box-containing protein
LELEISHIRSFHINDGVILFDSPSSSIILGYLEGSLIGSNAFDYIHPEDQNRVRHDFQDVCNKCNIQAPTEYQIRKVDGTYLYVESIALNLIGTPGIDGIVTTTHSIHNQKMAELEIRRMADDISAAYEEILSSEEELRENYNKLAKSEQALAKSESLFRGIFDTMPSGAVIYQVQNEGQSGRDYLILDMNNSALTYEGKKKEEVIGRSIRDLRPSIDDYGLIPVFEQVWRTGKAAYHPAKIYTDEQFSNWYESFVLKLPSGEIVSIYNDITEKMGFQVELGKLSQTPAF